MTTLFPPLGLIVREPWAGMLVDGVKTWEIRSRDTHVRGRIGLIRGGSGLVIGSTILIKTFRVTRERLLANRAKHRMSESEVAALFRPGSNYRTPWAWEMASPRRFAVPRPYRHHDGAVIWVRL